MSTEAENSRLWSMPPHEEEHESEHKAPTYPIFFIFFVAGFGALVRTMLLNCPCKIIRDFPYTVLMTIFGGLIGALQFFPNSKLDVTYLSVAHLNAHIILAVFLPCLIFSSAFEMEMHIFYKSISQILTLAGPGTLLSTGITAGLVYLIWEWNILCALLFGAIVSATDPVAVVSILQESGAPARLGVLIDGEALINDGAAIVLFTIFSDYEVNEGFPGFVFFVEVIFISPFIGLIMGVIASKLIGASYNDFITETMITISFAYIGFIIAEYLVKVSGVLVVLVLGLTLAHNKTSFSPQVYPSLLHSWEYITFLANTIIFFIVGVVIVTEMVHVDKPGIAVGETIAIYILVIGIRTIVIVFLYPILKRTGYGINWKTALTMIWGGLRGAVGLALALVVKEENVDNIYWHYVNHHTLKSRYQSILIWTIGVVLFTLIFNATTTGSLLNVLEFSKASVAKRINMAAALRKIEDSVTQMSGILQSDKFFADADWVCVEKIVILDNVYDVEEDDSDVFLDRKTTCPECNVKVQNQPSSKEVIDMVEESRHRLLRLEGVSYLTQYEQSRIGQWSTHELHSRTEELAETEEGYTDVEKVADERAEHSRLYAQVGMPSNLKKKKEKKSANKGTNAKNKSQAMEDTPKNRNADEEEKGIEAKGNANENNSARYPNKNEITSWNSRIRNRNRTVGGKRKLANQNANATPEEDASSKRCSQLCVKKMVEDMKFEVIFIIIIILNLIPIVYEATKECDNVYLFLVDNIFLALYIFEFIVRLIAHKKDYFPRSFWGWLDFVIVVMGFVSVIAVGLNPRFEGTPACKEPQSESTDSSFFAVKMIKLIRFFRLARLFRFCMPVDSKIIQGIINRNYSEVIEVSAALVDAQHDIKSHIRQVPISVYQPIDEVTQARNKSNIYLSQKKLAKFCSERPAVEVSIRTRQATAVVLDSGLTRVSELYQMGFLDDKDEEILNDILDKKKVNLRRMPKALDLPDYSEALKVVAWLDGDPAVQRYIVEQAELKTFNTGVDINASRKYQGLYFIASGTVLAKGAIGLVRGKAENWQFDHVMNTGEATRPDLEGDWSDKLPSNFLLNLRRPEGVIKDVQSPTITAKNMRANLLRAEFAFISRGSVINEFNAVAESNSVSKAICLSTVVAYFLPEDKVDEMLVKFSCRFVSLEARLWKSLATDYLRELKADAQDWQDLEMAFIVLIDAGHKSKSVSKPTFEMDYANFRHVMLLSGQAKIPMGDEMVNGPYELHHGEISLEFTPGKRGADEVVGVVLVVPIPGNDVNELFSPDLETIRDYAAEWMRTQRWAGSIDELLLRSIDHFDNSASGATADSSLFVCMKNRIQQVIRSVAQVSGKTITAQSVILNEGILAE